MLEGIEWGEYRVGDLFEVNTTRGLDEGYLELLPYKYGNGVEFVGRTMINNGVKGYVSEIKSFTPNPAGVISVSQIGSICAQIRPDRWYASQNLFMLTPIEGYEFLASLFSVAIINRALFGTFGSGYYNYPTLQTLEDLKIMLPTRDGEIDCEFMESFVAELKAQRVAELKAYMAATGLSDYTLTKEERQALASLDSVVWQPYKMEQLFKKIITKKLPYKAKELPTEPTPVYDLPCLTSSFMNQGLNYYAPRDRSTVLSHVISLPSNSDVYRAYYQSRDFTVLSDAYAIKWAYSQEDLTREQYLFLVSCINKVTDLPIYSYKNKLGGWNRVKEKAIVLPVKDGRIDFGFIQHFTTAIEKLAIRDVVAYADREIEATEQVVGK